MKDIIRASAWAGFADLVTELGGDADLILAEADVDRRMLADPDLYLPMKKFVASQAIAAQRLRRKDFGLLMGQRQTTSVLGALAIAIANAATPRDGVSMASRFLHIHNPTAVLTLSRIPRTSCDLLSCHAQLSDDTAREQNDERMMSTIHRVLKQLVGKTYLPVEVTFTHAALSPMSVYRKVFGVTPKFDQRSMGITIERSQLDVWRPGASAQLRETAEALLIRLARPNDKTYSQSVASMARGLLISGEFTPEQAAGALGLHARTLQRRLKDEGSSFEKIKDEARRDWAESLLSQPAVPLTQIANILGYADSSAFTRSCRRWFGEAPRHYRLLLSARRNEPATPRVSRVNSLEANLRARRRAGV